MVAKGSAVTASTLLNGLTVYYPLSNVNDSVGGLTLTNNNTVTFSAGKIGNAANFVAASAQGLFRADNAAFQFGTGNFSFSFWIKLGTVTADSVPMGYGKPQSGEAGFMVICPTASTIGVAMSDGVTGKERDSGTNIADAAFHLIVATFTRAGNLQVYLDNVAETALDITAASGSVNNANGFSIGRNYDAGHPFDGSVDELGLWNRVLTGAEISALWNSGAGVTYPF